MDLESIRQFVQQNPEGVVVRMVDGRVYEIPHRDYITFGPERTTASARRGPHATTFIVWEGDAFFLVNALLVAEVSALKANGNGHKKGPPGKGRTKKS